MGHSWGTQVFGDLIEAAPEGVIVVGPDGQMLLVNAEAERIFGYDRREMVGHPIEILLPQRAREKHRDSRARYGDNPHRRVSDAGLDLVGRRRDGSEVPVEVLLSPLQLEDGTRVTLSTVRDISARKQTEQDLRYLAEHDALTGARNRRRFEVDLAEQIDRARRYGEQAVLLIIDIDRFKQINDSRGHRAGDRALKDVADALRRRLRSTDLLARLGGDEFGVLLPHAGPPQAEAVAADLRRVVSDLNFDLPGAQHLTVSIGYAVVDQSSGDDVEVFAAADQAMYRDKFGNR